MSRLLLTKRFGNPNHDFHIFTHKFTTDCSTRDNSLDSHRHEYYSIEFITDGMTTQYINEEAYDCRRGVVTFMSPFDVHRYSGREKFTSCYLDFSEDILSPELWSNINIDSFPYVANLSDEDYRMLCSEFELIRREDATDDEFAEIAITAIVNKIIAILLRNADKKKTGLKSKNIRNAVSYIRYNFREPLTLSDVAEMFHVTPSYFCRQFKKYTNATFKEYILSQRLNYAMNQIKLTDKSITEISFESGFSSSAYFSKAFLEHFGKTPSEFRRI